MVVYEMVYGVLLSMNGNLLTQLEIILAVLAILSVAITAGSFAYSYFFGKLATALRTFSQIEEDTTYTKRKTNELAESVEKQGDILLALAKAHDDGDDDVSVESELIERDLGREPPYTRYVGEED